MKRVSILNSVLGPIMRGPSSSHTAGPWRIGRMARDLLGSPPRRAVFTFAPGSSLAVCYADQGSDRAYVAGLLARPLTDPGFAHMLDLAPRENLDVRFEVSPFPEADHPNSALLTLTGEGGREIVLHSRSVGGGSFEIASLNCVPLLLNGDSWVVFCEGGPGSMEEMEKLLSPWAQHLEGLPGGERVVLLGTSSLPPEEGFFERLSDSPAVRNFFAANPVMHPLSGKELFTDAASMEVFATEKGVSLGQAALAYESALLNLDEALLMKEMEERLDIMLGAVERGLTGKIASMKLMAPLAEKLWTAEEKGKMFLGGPHARTAIRSLAALHECASGGVVCAAPTGGAAGVIPGVMATLTEDFGISRDKILMALWAAGAIGLFHDIHSTFSAEVAGCQVEIGAAGAMAAAAVTEAAGGAPRQGCDAAALVFQNVMGSVCDLVQGVVEIPCHSRNAALASQAFLCADLVLGGYESPVPLDETIGAVDSVGRMLPEELRCTSKGGLALCPSARNMPRLDRTKKEEI